MKNKIEKNNLTKTVSLISIAILLFLLKMYFSGDKAVMIWLLWPVKNLVGFFTGIYFIFDSACGYVSYDRLVIISNRCSGLNFFIIAVFLSVFMDLTNEKTAYNRIISILIFIAASYMLTVVANTTRISVSIFLGYYKPHFEFLSQARSWVHEALGTFVFLLFLLSYYFVLTKGKSWIKNYILRDLKT